MKYQKKIILSSLILLAAAILFLQNYAWAKSRIGLNKSSITLTAGDSRKLSLKGISSKNQSKVSWKSSAPGTVSVNKNGKVTGKKAGKAAITASYKGKKYRCSVQVTARAPKTDGPKNENTPAADKNADTAGTSGQNTNKDTLADENRIHDTAAVTVGTENYRNFVIDNVYHSENEGDIHYHACFPDSYYESTESYALFITLPGYQGLYFQGVAENIRTEDFAFEAQKYNSKMVILAPQLNDWGQTSADQTLALTEYFLEHYRIDPSKVYIEGYSGGGETLSLVLGKKPELFAAALMCSSQWDGDYEPVVRAKTPVYFVIGESDEYYSSRPFKNACRTLLNLYEEQGLSETEIKNLLALDVKDASYFTGTGITYQHGGGYLFCRDEQIMGWLFAD